MDEYDKHDDKDDYDVPGVEGGYGCMQEGECDQCHPISLVHQVDLLYLVKINIFFCTRNCRSVSKRDRVAEKDLVLNSMTEEEEKNLQPQEDSFMWRGQEYSWPAPNLSASSLK